MIYDISIPIDTQLAIWPGDTSYVLRWTARKSEGSSVNLGEVGMSLHTGTHADGPFHFDGAGCTIDRCRLDAYIGPAWVVEALSRSVIRAADLAHLDFATTPRLLIRTGAWPDHSAFPTEIPVLATDVPDWLADRGVVLVGLDVPSVDAIDSKHLPNHHALASRGIHILESLDLRNVPEGRYELIALPLCLVGADASPVRAVLRG